MKRISILCLLLLVFGQVSFGQSRAGYSFVGNTMISDSLQKIVSQAEVPGAAAAILDSNGVLSMGVFGKRNISAKSDMIKEDRHHLGSCTKAMTSTMLATLIEEGALSWESTVLEVFPELKDSIHPKYHQVNLWQLVSHTAGVPANAENWFEYDSLPDIKKQRYQLLKDNLKQPPATTKGQFLYSNLGYMIAGCMAERITGDSWEELMQNRLFNPLGMTTAGFGPPGTLGKADEPWGHNEVNGKWEAVQMDNAKALGPAGTVHCSVEDWARFIALQLQKGDTKILTRNSLNKLVTASKDYAAGWYVVDRAWADGKALNHAGSNSTWYALVWAAPEKNRAFIVLTNSYNSASASVCDQMVGKLMQIDKELSSSPYGE